MAVVKEQKLKAALRKAVAERNAIKLEQATLEDRSKKLGVKIMELLEELGERETTSLFPAMDGFRLDKPETMVVNEEKLAPWLKERAPKVHKAVFKKVVQFDRKAFQSAVEAGDIPDVDEVLSDDDFVTFKPGTPRLMPTKAKADKKS